MKRPEGFTPAGGRATPAGKPAAKPGAKPAAKPGAKPAAKPGAKPVAKPGAKPAARPTAKTVAKPLAHPEVGPKSTTGLSPTTSPKSPIGRTPKAGPDPVRSAGRDLRRAAAARRRYERGEIKRFTRRSRQRRLTWLIVGGFMVAMLVVVTASVFSPLLSLKKVTVEGVSRLSASEVQQAVRGQLGKPLALVDFGAIKKELGAFPLIRSYVTETVPPDTIIIRVTERDPIGAITTATGFSVVDPAGIVINTAIDRPAGFPIIDLGAASTKSPAFTAAVSVLLALPAEVLKQVDSVTAQTKDDVSFTLAGSVQRVVWGSADQSALKARVLVALIKTQKPTAAVKYDVSAPTNPVVGPA